MAKTRRSRKPRKPRARFLKNGHPREWVIQSEILAWLETTGLMFWRQNSGTMFKCGRKIFLGPVGGADISLLSPLGRFCGLEVKTVVGKPNRDQVSYAKRLTDSGGLYFIVRSLTDAKNAIAEVLGHD